MQRDPRRGPIDASPYFWTTRRLGLRSWREDDLDLAVGLWGDAQVTRRIDVRPQLSPAEVRARLDREIETERLHGVQYWPLFLLETHAHVGCCGLRPRQPAQRIYELGVHIRSAYWRRGLAAEAAAGVIAYAFDRLGVASLFAGHHPDNLASRSLLEKLGFEFTHDELYPPTGLHHRSYTLRRPA